MGFIRCSSSSGGGGITSYDYYLVNTTDGGYNFNVFKNGTKVYSHYYSSTGKLYEDDNIIYSVTSVNPYVRQITFKKWGYAFADLGGNNLRVPRGNGDSVTISYGVSSQSSGYIYVFI